VDVPSSTAPGVLDTVNPGLVDVSGSTMEDGDTYLWLYKLRRRSDHTQLLNVFVVSKQARFDRSASVISGVVHTIMSDPLQRTRKLPNELFIEHAYLIGRGIMPINADYIRILPRPLELSIEFLSGWGI
jgi:hypothetical protein